MQVETIEKPLSGLSQGLTVTWQIRVRIYGQVEENELGRLEGHKRELTTLQVLSGLESA